MIDPRHDHSKSTLVTKLIKEHPTTVILRANKMKWSEASNFLKKIKASPAALHFVHTRSSCGRNTISSLINGTISQCSDGQARLSYQRAASMPFGSVGIQEYRSYLFLGYIRSFTAVESSITFIWRPTDWPGIIRDSHCIGEILYAQFRRLPRFCWFGN